MNKTKSKSTAMRDAAAAVLALPLVRAERDELYTRCQRAEAERDANEDALVAKIGEVEALKAANATAVQRATQAELEVQHLRERVATLEAIRDEYAKRAAK